MKKKVLMGLVLLAIIGTSAVFAQQPTLDKLKFDGEGSAYLAKATDKQIRGAVVIPDTYNGKPVVSVNYFNDCTGITSVTIPNSVTNIKAGAFRNCTGLTSIIIPASVIDIAINAFNGCTNLTSVTFQASNIKINAATNGINASFPVDLGNKYQAGGAGTYTRQAGSNTWTKQGGGFTLNGVWTRSDGVQITISGDGGQTLTIAGTAPNNGGRFSRNFAER
jgi:hypothetical protein